MNIKKTFFVIFIFLGLLSVSGCRQSFPKENFEKNVSEAFMKEFNLKVQPALIDKTLCIRIPVKQQIIPKDGSFDPRLREIVEDAMILSFRIVLSTDADVDFYKIIIFNENMPGICFNITRNTFDTKRFMLGDISRGDYADRMEMGVFFDSVALGTHLVQNFIKDAEKNDSAFLIQKYFPSFVSLNKIEPTLFKFFIEHDSKENRSFQITQLKTLSLSAQTALIYCRFRQSFTSIKIPENGKNHAEELIFKNNDEIELIFKISSALYPRAIDSIYTLSVLKDDGTLIYRGTPPELETHRDLSKWSMDLWDKKRVVENLPHFLSRQISTMITSSFSHNEKLSRKFIPTDILGFYQKENDQGKFYFSLNVIPRKSPESLSLKDNYHLDLIRHALKTIGQILIKKYRFKDYESVSIEYPLKNEVLEINKEDLKKLTKKRISFEELIQMKQASAQLSSSMSSY